MVFIGGNFYVLWMDITPITKKSIHKPALVDGAIIIYLFFFYLCYVTYTNALCPESSSVLKGSQYWGTFFFLISTLGIIRTAVSNMDRETRDCYAVVIQAKDMAGSVGGLSGSTTVNITLTDVNDNPPRFSQSKWSLSFNRWADVASFLSFSFLKLYPVNAAMPYFYIISLSAYWDTIVMMMRLWLF